MQMTVNHLADYNKPNKYKIKEIRQESDLDIIIPFRGKIYHIRAFRLVWISIYTAMATLSIGSLYSWCIVAFLLMEM